MTVYYVDYVNGLDANNGLGPDASHASNKPWKTLAKLLGASGFASGDTAYLSPAGPFREVVTVAMTSATAETKVIGDPGNVQGFKTSGGVAVAPGPIIWTAYTTNDKTAPSASCVLTLAGRDYLTFNGIMLVAGGANPGCVNATTVTSTNVTFVDCSFVSLASTTNRRLIDVTVAANVSATWLFDRCRMIGGGTHGLTIILDQSASADYDCNIVLQNTSYIGAANFVNVAAGASSTFFGGGVDLLNCSYLGGGAGSMLRVATGMSTSIPCTVYGCAMRCADISAGTSGEIVENYNLILTATPRTNVTAGANSISDGSYAPLFHFGQELQWGMTGRPFGMPIAGSPFLGFGGVSPPSVDIFNAPRPSGGASASTAVGAFERGNSFGKETTTTHTGSNAISALGPAYQDFQVPVDATSTTITVYTRWDATYAGTKPSMRVLNGEENGVTAATATATGSSGAWEQLSLNFTPTSAGIVTIRLVSSDTNGGGKCIFDTFAVA